MSNQYASFDVYGFRHLPRHLLRSERWQVLEELLTDFEFIEAKCLAGMVFDLLNDYDKALALRKMPPLVQMRKALSLAQPTLSDRPDLTIQSVYNRTLWFDPLEPQLLARLKAARSQLDVRGFWISAEAPWPGTRTSSPIAMNLKNSWIQSLSHATQRLAVCTSAEKIEILDITTGEMVERHSFAVDLCAIALGEDGQSLAYMGETGKISPVQGSSQLVGRKNESLLAYHPSGGILAVRADHALVCWYPKHDEAAVLARGLPSPLIVLSPSLNGQSVLFVAGYRNQTIGVSTWDGRDWTTRLLPYAGLPVVDACLDSEAGQILLATIDRRLSILDLDRGEYQAQLFYERRTDCPLRGAPVKCTLGIDPLQGWAFIATDTGQVAGWNWRQDAMERFESYRSPYEEASLVLMEVLPSSGVLFVTTNRQAKILGRSSPRSDQVRQQEPISACWLTTGNKAVAASEMGHTIRWFSAKGLIPLGVHADRFPTALSQGVEPDTILVGNRAGKVWQLRLDADATEESLLHMSEPVVSLFYREDAPVVVVAGKSGDVMCTSLTCRDYEKLWHSTGYQTRIKILPAGSYGLFWSLHRDEKLGRGAVVSLVQDVDQEQAILSGFDLIDLAVASDGATICVAGTDVQILQFRKSQWQCVFRRETSVERVCFLGEDNFLAVVLGRWLEVWQVAAELPTVATIDLLPTQTQVTCLYATGDRIAVGCRSGNLMSLSLQGIG